MTTNQDNPNTASECPTCRAVINVFCSDAYHVMNPTSGGISATSTGQLYNDSASVVLGEIVEAILFNVEQVCGPLNTEPCVILGDDDRSVLASAIRAALTASLPAIRAQAVAEIAADIRATMCDCSGKFIADELEQGAHDNGTAIRARGDA